MKFAVIILALALGVLPIISPLPLPTPVPTPAPTSAPQVAQADQKLHLPFIPRNSLPPARVRTPGTLLYKTGEVFAAVTEYKGVLYFASYRGRVYKEGQSSPIMDMSFRVAQDSEVGLSAIAFHNGRLCTFYTTPSRVMKIECGLVVVADLGHTDPLHHATGFLQSRPDGLYAGIGEGNRAYNPYAGKVVRLNDNGSITVIASGLRMPWAISGDYISEVGEGNVEEINLLVPGADYGWPCYEGNNQYAYCVTSPDGINPVFPFPHTLPTYSYGHGAGQAVVGTATLDGRLVAFDWTGAVIDLASGVVVRQLGRKVNAVFMVKEGVVIAGDNMVELLVLAPWHQ